MSLHRVSTFPSLGPGLRSVNCAMDYKFCYSIFLTHYVSYELLCNKLPTKWWLQRTNICYLTVTVDQEYKSSLFLNLWHMSYLQHHDR